METYSIISPSLEGVLSDDYLYFEGTGRPEALFVIRDGGTPSGENILILERYFNDIYNLFLRKLANFSSTEPTEAQDSLKLQALLQELIKVKSLIENASKA